MRLFAGLPLPEPLKRTAARMRDDCIGAGGGWRPARDEGLHVTMRFFGMVSEDRLASLHAFLRTAAGGCPILSLHGGSPCAVPSRRPRLLWIPVEDRSRDQDLARLAAHIEAASRE